MPGSLPPEDEIARLRVENERLIAERDAAIWQRDVLENALLTQREMWMKAAEQAVLGSAAPIRRLYHACKTPIAGSSVPEAPIPDSLQAQTGREGGG